LIAYDIDEFHSEMRRSLNDFRQRRFNITGKWIDVDNSALLNGEHARKFREHLQERFGFDPDSAVEDLKGQWNTMSKDKFEEWANHYDDVDWLLNQFFRTKFDERSSKALAEKVNKGNLAFKSRMPDIKDVQKDFEEIIPKRLLDVDSIGNDIKYAFNLSDDDTLRMVGDNVRYEIVEKKLIDRTGWTRSQIEKIPALDNAVKRNAHEIVADFGKQGDVTLAEREEARRTAEESRSLKERVSEVQAKFEIKSLTRPKAFREKMKSVESGEKDVHNIARSMKGWENRRQEKIRKTLEDFF
jgi:hypothetical protein